MFLTLSVSVPVCILRALGLFDLMRRGGIGHLHSQPLPLFGKL
jgi:hypothetical protein